MHTRFTAWIAFLAALAVLAGTGVTEARDLPAPTLAGRTVTSPKHAWTVAPSGLPEQLAITAAPAELPLDVRGKAAAQTPDLLNTIGRGPQLRAPIRVEASIGGQTVVAEAAAPGPVALEGTLVKATATLAAGAVPVQVETRYDSAGVFLSLVYGGKGTEVDKLSLVFDLAGPVDTVVYGDTVLPLVAEEGQVWANVGDSLTKGGPAAAGVLPQLFVGSGDRGYTLRFQGAEGWDVDPAAPTATLTRDAAGNTTLTLLLVNHTAKLAAAKTFNARLLVHPVSDTPANARRLGWLAWPHGDAVIAGDPATVQQTGALRADIATVLEATADAAVLTGPAGGDAAAGQTLAETFPLARFRYLAATHTGLLARLVPNAVAAGPQGGLADADRIAVGRALLHDIGLDARGVGDLTMVANVASALEQFGYFKDDGALEYIPYWRSGAYLRYGESFTAQGEFATTKEDPNALVKTSLYRHALPEGGYAVLFVIVNEGPTAARSQLTLTESKALFGGANKVNPKTLITQKWSFAGIPEDSDWNTRKLTGSATPRDTPKGGLIDLEDQGWVQQSSTENGLDIYGPVYIPAHSFRLLYGAASY